MTRLCKGSLDDQPQTIAQHFRAAALHRVGDFGARVAPREVREDDDAIVESLGEMVTLLLTEKPRELQKMNNDVPAPIAKVVMQTLAMEPASRPTLREVRSVLAVA